jgi:hypothetical protein
MNSAHFLLLSAEMGGLGMILEEKRAIRTQNFRQEKSFHDPLAGSMVTNRRAIS